MTNKSLLDYIDQAKAKNISDDQILDNLVKAGWSKVDVLEALSSLQLPVPSPSKSDSYSPSHGMWDAFQHIIMFISLYVSATSLALILHFYVDAYFPGIGRMGYPAKNQTLLNGYYSALIVSLPVFITLFYQITKKTKLNPVIKNLNSRKKLIYLTLIITFITVLSNLSSIIFNFLSGNVTLNFFLHFLVTVGISSLIFSYYISQVIQDRKISA